ncbi:SDR family oxidoreductase [Ancylomarina salipaludis]|uniref:SDR family oxidoreductase n=1 Tax=Ancylomarina salipaludis TaxID=2501299 RepID=A0A4V1N048_9BACT|nr:SDR family oxidoreductase [Ancylomarina salipaludis]RXQ94531.1 SDR family oxidoreductase [Ancylomarina salipaludis]
MKILLTGATGYIGKRLLPILIENGHQVVCCVRDIKRFNPPPSLLPHIEVIQVDLLDSASLRQIPEDIAVAYYLVHSMSSSSDYEVLEKQSAINFRQALNKTQVQQVIYLSGIINETILSKHLKSRGDVELELQKGKYNLTTLRAGIIIGSGSASFEIIRDLVEKIPIMITPKWLNTKCQPIAIRDVIAFLSKSLLNSDTYNQDFDIGGPDILTYKEMLLEYARVRKLIRRIIIVPVMTPRLSSYWLYFVTTTSYKLAIALVNSMKIEVICRDDKINQILDVKPLPYKEALSKAFLKIESNEVVSSWKDSLISGRLNIKISDFINVPKFGCLTDQRTRVYADKQACLDKIWRIGGKTGWYYADRLWKFRGYIDRIMGGVGLRRGRRNKNKLSAGDTVDFWRVLYANKKEGRLLLFAEMILPGEAWLEFKIDGDKLIQTATYRPKGLPGRLYWYIIYPFHGFIFRGLLKQLTK